MCWGFWHWFQYAINNMIPVWWVDVTRWVNCRELQGLMKEYLSLREAKEWLQAIPETGIWEPEWSGRDPRKPARNEDRDRRDCGLIPEHTDGCECWCGCRARVLKSYLRDDVIRMEELLKEVQGTLLTFPLCATQWETTAHEQEHRSSLRILKWRHLLLLPWNIFWRLKQLMCLTPSKHEENWALAANAIETK